ncbi:MAG: glycosyhydrolase [Segetibacter sp.]|nr:glycosyhydrolase [Segetibacter sp.]
MKKKSLLLCCLSALLSLSLSAQQLISAKKTAASFPIVSTNQPTTIYVDANDYAVVRKAAELMQHDIKKVTGKKPPLTNAMPAEKNVIIVGTIGKSKMIDELITLQKINIDTLKGKWEAYQLQVVKNPFKGVDNALIITGSDRRGTAYGVFELTQQIGISPWHYWADVPVQKKNAIYYTGQTVYDAPAVKYRGIFINDEAPALSGWSKEKFGGFNHQFYEKVFELILRMKGNYLWPAMWGSAFNDDDTLNPVVAEQYGIVMGTSHHEPLVRAHDEWRRYGKGKWNYDSNVTNLKGFWKDGIKRIGTRENIVSIGMRGDGDEPMTQGTAIALLERIVKDQREIIADVTRKPAAATPQLWALYKEVQDYYDKGMRVPDDVTLLLCDDNWGNIRKLPKLSDKTRTGGYGIYYHFDYVGGPRNYKWINTNQVERTWEQMHLAYEHGVDKIWIVNVGDIKPMELPTQFFLDYAWKPSRWNANNLPKYYEQWADKNFGSRHAKAIADIVAKYTKYNSRRKPELLSPETYSLTNYNEADRVVEEYKSLLARAESIYKTLPATQRDAYYQLVLHPVQASANINELYVTVAKNRAYAKQNHPLTNAMADKAKSLYLKDSLITKYYNDTLAGGKWSHMMDQTHIGYTYWQQPLKNVMPQVQYVNTSATTNSSTGNSSKLSTQKASTKNKPVSKSTKSTSFNEKDGYVSMEAEHYTNVANTNGITWQVIPNLGRTLSAITPFPVTAKPQTVGVNSPRLEYVVNLKDTGTVKVHTYLSPTLPFHNEGLRFAISINDEAPQIINMNSGYNEGQWNKWVADNIIIKVSEHRVNKVGQQVLKFWMVDPGVVLQKIVVDAGGLKSSYLGPEETKAP